MTHLVNKAANRRQSPAKTTNTPATAPKIENIVPCFTPGTVIATLQGERLIEDLKVGDRVVTRDNGMQEIRWIGARRLLDADLRQVPDLRPVLIRAGALSDGLPERDVLASPWHKILIQNDNTALFFDEREVLAAARHLVGQGGVSRVDVVGVTYLHLMFDQHQVVLSNGIWSESFHPDAVTLESIGAANRNEIFDLFPALRDAAGLKAYELARRELNKTETRLLVR